MNNVYEKAQTALAVLESKAAGYRLQGATEERGLALEPEVQAVYDKLFESKDPVNELCKEDFAVTEDPSYKLMGVLREIKGLEETLSLPLAQTGSAKYLITDGDLVSPAGYYNDGVYVKNDVWIETNRLPKHVGGGLTVYNLHEIAAKQAA